MVCQSFFAMLGALGFHFIAEDVTNHGRTNLTLCLPQAVCIVEFKVGTKEPDNAALAQIQARNYAQKYAADNRPIILIGIVFAQEERNIAHFTVLEKDNPLLE